jgi:carboxyl-terminal processing protease
MENTDFRKTDLDSQSGDLTPSSGPNGPVFSDTGFTLPERSSDKVKRNYVLGLVIAMVLIGGFTVGRYTESLKPVEPSPQCEGRLVGVGDDPPLTLEDVDFSDFWRTWQTVKDRHVSEPQSDLNLFYGALEGLVGSLGDPYSVFFDPEFAQRFNDELSGTFEGIGAEIGIKQNLLTIIAPLPGTPASRAGLRPRDRILAVDGEDTSNMSLDYAVSKIRGEKGSTVMLLIGRNGWSEAEEVPIIRDTIFVQSVQWETVEHKGKKIGIITISHFNEDTEASFSQGVREMLLEDPEGIILDLRSNPGGFLDTAVKVAGEWISHDVVLREKFGDNNIKDYVSDGQSRLSGSKTLVLVNGGSASASEIVAGALQDYGKATIVGDQTYGKGSVQDYTEYNDGSALKLTVALWYTPKDRSIDKDGITPDIFVLNTFEDFNNDFDPQMEKALDLLVGDIWPPPPEPKPADEDIAAEEPADQLDEEPSNEEIE